MGGLSGFGAKNGVFAVYFWYPKLEDLQVQKWGHFQSTIPNDQVCDLDNGTTEQLSALPGPKLATEQSVV